MPGVNPLCIEYLRTKDTYRFAYSNPADAPYLFQTPPGVALREPSVTSENVVAEYLLRRPGMVRGGGALEASYRAAASHPSSRVVGRPDTAAWALHAYRQVLLTTVGRGPDGKRPQGDARLVDEALVTEPVTSCLTREGDRLVPGATISDAARVASRTMRTCYPAALSALADSYAVAGGGAVGPIRDRLAAEVPWSGPMVRRAETDWRQILLLSEGAHPASPATVSLPVPRFMTKDEAFALPTTPTVASRPCSRPPAPGSPAPMRMPAGMACWNVVPVDLDGDGAQDRLITRSATSPTRPGQGLPGGGATAYLATGEVASLPRAEVGGDWLQFFSADHPVYLSNDRRGQVAVATLQGAHTDWYVVVGLASDGTLRLATTER